MPAISFSFFQERKKNVPQDLAYQKTRVRSYSLLKLHGEGAKLGYKLLALAKNKHYLSPKARHKVVPHTVKVLLTTTTTNERGTG